MKDQYGNIIEDLLVVLPFDVENLTDKEIDKIFKADWYDVYIQNDPDETETIYLMTPDYQIDVDIYDCLFVDPKNEEVSEELGYTLVEITKVDDCLKRFSLEDGFYHV